MAVVVNGPIHTHYGVIFRNSMQLESSDATDVVHNINQYLSIRSGFNTIPEYINRTVLELDGIVINTAIKLFRNLS